MISRVSLTQNHQKSIQKEKWNILLLCYIILFQATPGPGKYDIKGIFDPEPPKVNTEGVEVEHPPFMSQAKVRHVSGLES